MRSGSKCSLLLTVLLFASLITSALLIWILLSAKPPKAHNPYETKVRADLQYDKKISSKLQESFSSERIRSNLERLTSNVHLAGTTENNQLASFIQQTYTNLGFDRVKTSHYQVLLGYPNFDQPNTVHVRTANGTSWKLLSSGLATPLGPPDALEQQADPKARLWYYSLSPSGAATGPLIFAGHGSSSEFDYLLSRGITANGSIVLMHSTGGTFEAQKRGAKAVIGYVDTIDPFFAVPRMFPKNFTFPNSMYLPKTDILRFRAVNHHPADASSGDLLTKYYPSKPYVHRELDYAALQARGTLPSIPMTQVGQSDGGDILNSMTGVPAPSFMVGDLDGVTYRLDSPGKMYRVEVNSVNHNRRNITNICSYIYGWAEPDLVVVLSNHYDAWTFGAIDPNSGTAVLLEAARVLMQVASEQNWRPRRTLAFCHWDAEEHGVIGSTEWLEEHMKLVRGRIVANINVDLALAGNTTLVATGDPLLHRTLLDAAQTVANPNKAELAHGRRTLFDSWLHYFPGILEPDGQPLVGMPRVQSDDYPFVAYGGVPSAFPLFICAPVPCYGLYHTMYEVEWTVEHLVDSQFHVSRALGQFWLETGRSLADSVIIPLNVHRLVPFLRFFVWQMDWLLTERNMTTSDRIDNYAFVKSNLDDAVDRFAFAAESFQQQVDKITQGEVSATVRQVAMLNERLATIESAFLNDRGIYPNRLDKHVLWSKANRPWQGRTFPAVSDSTFFYLESLLDGNSAAASRWLGQLRRSLTDVQYAIESAILLLDVASSDN